jgi:hypothetical protein
VFIQQFVCVQCQGSVSGGHVAVLANSMTPPGDPPELLCLCTNLLHRCGLVPLHVFYHLGIVAAALQGTVHNWLSQQRQSWLCSLEQWENTAYHALPDTACVDILLCCSGMSFVLVELQLTMRDAHAPDGVVGRGLVFWALPMLG